MSAPRLLTTAVIATFVITGCSSTVSGKGTAAGGRATSSASHDFPTGSTPAPSPTGQGSSGGAPTSAVPASPTAKVHPVPGTPLATKTVHSTGGTTYVVKVWAQVRNTSCFDHAYGQPMIDFLTKHPCAGLQRILATTSVQGRPVGFAESSTGFAGSSADPYKWAGAFAKLENQDGTGSISDLMREGYRLPRGPSAVPSSEAFNVLGQDNGVTVWDVWYLDGPTPANAKPLIKMTEDLFLQI